MVLSKRNQWASLLTYSHHRVNSTPSIFSLYETNRRKKTFIYIYLLSNGKLEQLVES